MGNPRMAGVATVFNENTTLLPWSARQCVHWVTGGDSAGRVTALLLADSDY